MNTMTASKDNSLDRASDVLTETRQRLDRAAARFPRYATHEELQNAAMDFARARDNYDKQIDKMASQSDAE